MSDVKRIVNKILEGADVREALRSNLNEDLEFHGLYRAIKFLVQAYSSLSAEENADLLNKLRSLEAFI